MKTKTTNKQINSNFSKIVKIGYCDAQYLLSYKNPFAYTCGVYGWSADFYEIGNICISTGYRPIGESVNYKILSELENKARKIYLNYNLKRETKEKKNNELLNILFDSLNK